MSQVAPRARVAVREFILIVAGVFAALAAQAWWEGQQNRGREHSSLQALKIELVDVQREFREDGARLDLAMKRVRDAVMILSLASAETISDDSVAALDLTFGPSRVFYTRTAALDDIVRTGGIRLIRSDTLRRELAAYQQMLARDLAEQEALVELWLTQMAPYRFQHSALRLPDSLFQYRIGLGYKPDRHAYVRNRTYANLLIGRMLRMKNVRITHDSVAAQVGRVLALLPN